MMLLLWLLGGLVLGAAVERVVGPGRAAADDAAGPGAAPARPRRRRSKGRIVAWVGVGIVGLLVVAAVGGYLWASAIFGRIEKVDVSAQLSNSPAGTNYLLVGSDNGRNPGDQRDNVLGARSDTIMVLRVVGGKATMLSLNRDLWVTNPATGEKGRLNATYNAGPANLVQAVTESFGIPIDRYLEIDFVSFAGLVDSFGGIDVDFAHPALDRGSGLVVPTAGRVHLDGAQALAFVRSRHYTEVIDGQEVPEGGLPDVNRTQRQQVFLREIMAKAGSKRNPFTLLSAADKMAAGLRVDDDMTTFDAIRFGWQMGRLNPESVVLPVTPRTTSGGAAVLDLGPGADEVLAQFR
ncbi:MAG: LCP family protein [Actinobacteria bacterium]|nr:LCP family protein [Actinomycetota bacterium]